jgi:hypothetical protein
MSAIAGVTPVVIKGSDTFIPKAGVDRTSGTSSALVETTNTVIIKARKTTLFILASYLI